MNAEIENMTDEEINDLAAEWYFLSLQTKLEDHEISDDTLNQLIEVGLKLKAVLIRQQYTRMEPLSIFVDDETYLDIWADEEGQINTGALFAEEN